MTALKPLPTPVDRTVRLVKFLARVQQLRSGSPRTLDAYRQGPGGVLWLAEAPEHPAVTSAGPEPGPEDVLLSVDRIARTAPPEPPPALAARLSGPLDDPQRPPELDAEAGARPASPGPPATDASPPSGDGYARWRAAWDAWAAGERRDAPVRDLYGRLFAMHVAATGHPEDLELVAGIGCLAWKPAGEEPVLRHLLTAPAAVGFDDDTGRLSVVRVKALDALTVELDMLDPGRVAAARHLGDIRTEAQVSPAHPLHRGEHGTLVRRLVHTLDADGGYDDDGSPPVPGPRARAAFAPALILRRRSRRDLVELYEAIGEELTHARRVPEGMLPLVDPDHVPATEPAAAEPGARVVVGGEPFLPLPADATQRRILDQVDARAQTLVQGPPGTGKTHTAALLVSHLLAQGKRVLVTAHTDRALKEVRERLPAAIRPLSVAVVGTSREDMSDLKTAVERIASAAAEHDAHAGETVVADLLTAVDRLGAERAELRRRLVETREREVRVHEHHGFGGTPAAIAVRHRELAGRHGWIAEYAEVPADAPAPLERRDADRWLALLLDEDLAADAPEAAMRLVAPSAAPGPDIFAGLIAAAPGLGVLTDRPASVPAAKIFADLVAAERAAADAAERYAPERAHRAYRAVSRLDPERRTGLRRRLHSLADETEALAGRRDPWTAAALADALAGRASRWRARADRVAGLLDRAAALVDRLGPLTHVEVAGEVAPAAVLARDLVAHLDEGGRLKAGPDGTVKVTAFTAKPVKRAQPLFDAVRVDGMPPTTRDRLDAFLVHADALAALAAVDRAWPENAPAAGGLHDRCQWHVAELARLHRILDHADALAAEAETLAAEGLPRPDWTDPAAVRAYADLAEAAAADDARTAAAGPLRRLAETIGEVSRWRDAAPCVRDLDAAVAARDPQAYDAAHRRLVRLHEVRRDLAERDRLGGVLGAAAPKLRAAIEADPADPVWTVRLGGFAEAWDWAATGAWLAGRDAEDVNLLRARLAGVEERIRRRVEELAATRAWAHAVSPDRLTGGARADLTHYAQLVQRLGKGTGKYAVKRKAEIRRAMDRCREAVPVWIMPIYRIAEQLRIRAGMFDVVIVDEASQAGLEATFLQYLAPRIVVIGDDRQVSPSAVGVNQQQLRDLAGQYLADDPYRASWQDPRRSLFDEAKMRFRGMLTLTEHRRCVPEIIGFSNRIAYEPDGIRLLPVRQYGADRLDPVRTVHVPGGSVRGGAARVNTAEVDAVVDQVAKCIADPRYDGLTFGVISLLGPAQAKAIERELLDRVPPEEWAARDLRCGDSADFQGAERDVVFLSMVAAPADRLGALTGEAYVQRFNVAASRARDQMWLFHSLPPSALGNPEDMRFRLLDYCTSVERRTAPEVAVPPPAGEDVIVDPFTSLFEQRVHDRLAERGYAVVPSFPVDDHRIGLVVVGAHARLGVVCDGDSWHGRAAYERELARQRDLERCGWHFHHVRQSAFAADEEAVLAALEEKLRERGIRPVGREEGDGEPASGEVGADTALPGRTPAE